MYYDIAQELVIGYVALFAVTKLLGKSTISHLTPFDFIASIVLGELVGNALFDEKIGIPYILFAVAVWGTLIFVTEWITQKFRKTRLFLEGSPTVIINKGTLSYKALKKNRLDLDQFQHLLRSRDVFSMREVEYAILERDGTLSVLKKSSYDNTTRQDLKLPDNPVYLAVVLITDGSVIWENLDSIGLSEAWLTKELNKQNKTFDKVLYAEWLEGDGLFIQGY